MVGCVLESIVGMIIAALLIIAVCIVTHVNRRIRSIRNTIAEIKASTSEIKRMLM